VNVYIAMTQLYYCHLFHTPSLTISLEFEVVLYCKKVKALCAWQTWSFCRRV